MKRKQQQQQHSYVFKRLKPDTKALWYVGVSLPKGTDVPLTELGGNDFTPWMTRGLKLDNLPHKFDHNFEIGKIWRSFNHDGKKYVIGFINTGTQTERYIADLMLQGYFRDLSLTHELKAERNPRQLRVEKKVTELSSVNKGNRDGCQIFNIMQLSIPAKTYLDNYMQKKNSPMTSLSLDMGEPSPTTTSSAMDVDAKKPLSLEEKMERDHETISQLLASLKHREEENNKLLQTVTELQKNATSSDEDRKAKELLIQQQKDILAQALAKYEDLTGKKPTPKTEAFFGPSGSIEQDIEKSNVIVEVMENAAKFKANWQSAVDELAKWKADHLVGDTSKLVPSSSSSPSSDPDSKKRKLDDSSSSSSSSSSIPIKSADEIKNFWDPK